MVRWKRDVIYGIVLLLFCGALYWQTSDLPRGTSKIFASRADVYVWFWLIILAALAIILIFNALRKKNMEVLPPIWSNIGVLSIISLIVYLLIMPFLGFLISTFVFLFVMIVASSRVQRKLEGDRRTVGVKLIRYAIFCIIFTVLMEQIFRKGLDVLLPSFNLF